jgi:hypothetical protein
VGPGGPPTRLEVAAGGDQTGTAGSAVGIAPTVVVRDDDGNGIPGVGVTFTVTGGGGTVTPGAVTTATDGRAAPDEWTLGTTVGANTLRALAAAMPGASVEFTAEATPGPVDASRSTVTATPASIPTGRCDQRRRGDRRDAFGNPVPGLTVELSARGSDNTLVQPPATAANGQLRRGSQDQPHYCTIGDVPDKMDVYVPSASMPRPLPVAVHVHGGGWVSGSRSTGTSFAELKEALLARGATWSRAWAIAWLPPTSIRPRLKT